MRFTQTTDAGSWTKTTAEAISKMEKDGIFGVVLETPEDIWCLEAIIVANDKIVVEEGGVAVAKPLIVTKTTFSPGTSTLTVTGTLEESWLGTQPRDVLCGASTATKESQISLFSGHTVTVERRISDFASRASWSTVCQRLRTATMPDRRSEALAVVLLDRDGSKATLRVFEGEQLRLDKTINTADFKDDAIIDMPKMTIKTANKTGCSSRSEKPCKASKMSRSTKAHMAPLQGNLYAAVIARLVRFIDIENIEYCCPLLVASLGEAGRSFQNFLQAEATTKQNSPLLHMANNAIVVDTYGAASQAESCETSLSPRGKAASKSKKTVARAGEKNGKTLADAEATTASAAGSADDADFRAAFEANLWMPAQRKKRNKKSMCAFDEMMMRLDVLNQIHNVRFKKASDLVRDLLDCMREEEHVGAHKGRRAVYGARIVEKVVKEGAVVAGGGALLVNKSLFHGSKLQDTVATLAVSVREQGGAVHIISDTHECGQRLAKLGGIAALLAFPLFDLDNLEDEDKKEGKTEDRIVKPELENKGRKKTKASRV
ncbi:Translation factor pelota [Sporothrix epigloea]|uniref:Translation factor pelota n=1 Tax=Sporothrix epigloea TaxID=1892477 RepID=A0ABP0DTV7_9PEZI